MEITLDWLIGFIEGEGYFAIHHIDRPSGPCLMPAFGISQKDACDTLYEIQNFLGFGRVYHDDDKNLDFLQVRKLDDCIKVINLLDGKLHLTKRQKQFDRWKEICLKVRAGFTSHRLNSSRHWLPEEEEKAKALLMTGCSYEETAVAVEHSKCAIMNRNYKRWRILRGSRYV